MPTKSVLVNSPFGTKKASNMSANKAVKFEIGENIKKEGSELPSGAVSEDGQERVHKKLTM